MSSDLKSVPDLKTEKHQGFSKQISSPGEI